MKKILLMALVAVVTLASCSKENVGTKDNETGNVALSVKIDMSKFTTKSGDDSFTNIAEWDKILLVVTDKDNNFVTEKTITKDELATMSGKVALIEKSADVKLIGGKVTAYVTTKDNEWGALTATGTPNLPVLVTGQSNINNWQPSGFIKTTIAGKFVNVPYHGVSNAIAKTGINTDGHELLEATVEVTPELSRIQVIGTPQNGGEKNGYTVSSLTLENIYINRITSGGKIVDIRTKNESANVDSDTWKGDFYAAEKPLVGMHDATTNKGYQVFGGDTPHVIVEVKYKLTKDGEEGAEEYTGYLTVQNFTYGSVDSGDLTAEKGKIYDIDLSKLVPSYDKIGDDPYDKTIYHDLVVTVKVNAWTKVSVTPSL